MHRNYVSSHQLSVWSIQIAYEHFWCHFFEMYFMVRGHGLTHASQHAMSPYNT